MAIAAKILEIMKKVGKIDASKMQFGSTNYNFISEAELTKAIREAMIEVGVVIVPTVSKASFSGGETEKHELETVRNGQPVKRNVFLSSVGMCYKAIDIEDNSEIDLFGYGVGMDDGDKCGAKAMTAAFKAMQRQLFFIPSPSKEDPDTTASEAYNPKPESTGNPEDIVFQGGKHAGKTLKDVLELDRSYLVWMVEKSDKTPKEMREAAKALLEKSSH